MVERVLSGRGFDAVAVTVGPGSFTGLRAAMSLAHGLAAAGVPLVGVTVAEALAEQVVDLGGRSLWVAIDTRRGRVFLDRDGGLRAVELPDLPLPVGPVAVAGDAAIIVCATLAARGVDVRLTDARLPHARYVALAAQRRLDSGLALREVQPVYVDPPEAKLPAGGLRPAPAP
jgi:tRNA threonylcarbamoyl adenosine modification protein YeaZ